MTSTRARSILWYLSGQMTRSPVRDLHPSNLLTYVSLAAAVGAIAASRAGKGLSLSGALLALSAVSDTFDGRFARSFARTDRQQRIGRELDSLVDAVVFGLAPVIVLAEIPGRTAGTGAVAWWAAAFVYVLAAVTRLSAFNVEEDGTRFVGLPTPAMALIWSTVLLWSPPPAIIAWLFVLCGVAMVGAFTIPRPRGIGLAAFALWAVALIVAHLVRTMMH
jgi:phosphatidylserine synthase